MKLSENTIDIISSIRDINAGSYSQGAIFKAGSTIKARRWNTKAPIMYAEIEEGFPRDFAIFDLKKFLSILSLIKDPELIFDDDYLTMKGDRKRVKLRYTPPHLIENDQTFFDKNVSMPPIDFHCKVSQADLKAVKSAASIMGSGEIAFICQPDGVVVLTNYNHRDPKAERMEIEVGKYEGNPFTIILDLALIQFLPRDYVVEISTRGILRWKTDNLEYFITMSEKSKV